MRGRKVAENVLIWGVPVLSGLYFISGVLSGILPLWHFDSLAVTIRSVFSQLCHQLPERTFYLWGNPLAFCSRCTGFYGGIFVTSLILASRGRGKPIGIYLAIGLAAPALIDVIGGVSAILPWPNLWRCVTGLVGAAGVVWFGYPRYIAAIRR